MYVMQSAPGPRTIINGKTVDYFGGTGYFCLQGHPEVIAAANQAMKLYGIGSATSRVGFGTNPVLLEVEKKAALFFETQDAIYFSSGYFGPTILLEGLRGRFDIIYADREAHYSIFNAAALAKTELVTYGYRDPEDLKKKIHDTLKPSAHPLIFCDGIFPISGELSPVEKYWEIIRDIDSAILCVDDAHATGVIGEKGHGVFEYLNMADDRLYSCGTLSKGIGGHGGVIAGKHDFIKNLKVSSRLFHASTPTPVPAAAATAKALELLSQNLDLRTKLWDNTYYAKKCFRELGFPVNSTPVPIICLAASSFTDLSLLQKELFEKDIAITWLPPGAYTSVPSGGGLRITILASHTREQIDHLVYEIKCKL